MSVPIRTAAGYGWREDELLMSDHVSDMDEQMRREHGLNVQPAPVHNDLPSAHDMVALEMFPFQGVESGTSSFSVHDVYVDTLNHFEDLATALGKKPQELMEARKEFGLRKYGTILQPGNGRDHLEDALDELADALVYLRCAIYEERGQ